MLYSDPLRGWCPSPKDLCPSLIHLWLGWYSSNELCWVVTFMNSDNTGFVPMSHTSMIGLVPFIHIDATGLLPYIFICILYITNAIFILGVGAPPWTVCALVKYIYDWVGAHHANFVGFVTIQIWLLPYKSVKVNAWVYTCCIKSC